MGFQHGPRTEDSRSCSSPIHSSGTVSRASPTCGTGPACRSRTGLVEPVTNDEWHAYVTREAAKAIGEGLEGRGRLHPPIQNRKMVELDAMASNAISRFIVLASHRIKEQPEGNEDLTLLLLG